MARPQDDEVEKLLNPAARAQLPFGRLLLLYLDPFALFKDASCGPDSVRRRARSYNRSMRWILLAYLQRWTLIGTALFACIMPAEALAADLPLLKIPAAACAVGSCIAVAVIVCTAAAYLLLAARD